MGSTASASAVYAEYKCLRADGVIAPKPAGLGYEEAAALPYGGLLALSFLRGRIRRGQQVLVYGASGAVGTAAVQLARHDGAWVTGVCGGANLDWVASFGADAVIDYTRRDVTQGASGTTSCSWPWGTGSGHRLASGAGAS
jgi:NADPH:quinone reductase-like Zn-dependent oxidoreductase